MRSEAWRPAAAARNRSPREARDPALQALRPGCEELAARIREAPARRCRTTGAEGAGSAAPGAQNRHGGAPRGERPASWDARRLARRLAYRVISAFTRVFDAHDTPHGCSAEHPNVSRRSAHPSFGVSEAKLQTPGAKTRRGNESGCLKSE